MEQRQAKYFMANFGRVFIYIICIYMYYIKLLIYLLKYFYFRLESIHRANVVHRDFHSGNILLDLDNQKRYQWHIGDLGLSQPADNSISNNEIYGVIPYIAPEIFKGSKFSRESDVYSFGMIMWELTTGRKPFADVEHDHILIYQIINGKQPEITNDTPECFCQFNEKLLGF